MRKKLIILLLAVLAGFGGLLLGRYLMMKSVPPLAEVESFLYTVAAQTGWKDEGTSYNTRIVMDKLDLSARMRRLACITSSPDREITRRFTSDGKLVAITLFTRGDNIIHVRVSSPRDPLLVLQAERMLFGWFPDLEKVR